MKLINRKWILLLGLLLVLPVTGAAQVWTVQSNKGWIGISFNYASVRTDGADRTAVIIEGVAEGSPAEAAGIRVGDTLTHLDGQPISEEVMANLVMSLEVGDLVRMTVLRGNRSKEVLVEAAPQRTGMTWYRAPDASEVVLRLDSVRGAILDNLDSLRVSISNVHTVEVDSLGSFSIRILPSDDHAQELNDQFAFTYRLRSTGPDSSTVVTDFEFPGMDHALPFGAYVVATEETEPLRAELRRLRKELTEIRRSEQGRLREIQAGAPERIEELARQDEKIQQLKVREQTILQQQMAVSEQLQRVSEENLQRQFFEGQLLQERALAEALQRRDRNAALNRAEEEALRNQTRSLMEEFEAKGPSIHIIAGQNFVAGAQLTALNPELAEYFGVDRGLLVTEVLEKTPAADAGVLAGDVIVRVGTEDVTSMDDLRFAVGFFERPLRLRVIRKGNSMEIVIRK